MFYEDFKPNPMLSLADVKKTFTRDSEQYRDGCVRYTSVCENIKVVYNMFYKTLTFTRRVYPEKDADGKYVIDCNKHSVNRDVQVSIKELQFCSQCGKHKMYHSLLSPCKFTEPNDRISFRQVDLPEWLPEDVVIFKNKRDTDRVVFSLISNKKIESKSKWLDTGEPLTILSNTSPSLIPVLELPKSSLELRCIVNENEFYA